MHGNKARAAQPGAARLGTLSVRCTAGRGKPKKRTADQLQAGHHRQQKRRNELHGDEHSSANDVVVTAALRALTRGVADLVSRCCA